MYVYSKRGPLPTGAYACTRSHCAHIYLNFRTPPPPLAHLLPQPLLPFFSFACFVASPSNHSPFAQLVASKRGEKKCR